MKRRLLLLAMSAGMLTSVSAQAPNLGTAKADGVQLYAQSDDKANLDAPVNAQLNYRVVDDGTYFWAHYTIVPTNETETTIENAAWAAQLRNWGPNGDNKTEMDLTVRTEDQKTAYSHREGKTDVNYYALTNNNGTTANSTVQLQAFLSLQNGIGWCVTELTNYTVGSINNETLLIDKSLLNKLAEKYNLAIFTGRPGQEALFTLSKFEIKDYFGKIVTMDDLPKDRQKPDAMGLSIIKDSFFTDYLVYFGDSIDDMKCAKNFVSTFAVGVLPPQNKTDDLKHTLQHSGADKVINCINDLQKILENN